MYIGFMRQTTTRNARNVQEIGLEMYRLVETYASDLGSLALLPFPEFFDHVKRLAYRKEPGRFQILARQSWTQNGFGPVVACANKAILIGSWAYLHKLPYRFVAVGRFRNSPLSHVFAQVYINGNWQNADATYPWHQPFQDRQFGRVEILKRK